MSEGADRPGRGVGRFGCSVAGKDNRSFTISHFYRSPQRSKEVGDADRPLMQPHSGFCVFSLQLSGVGDAALDLVDPYLSALSVRRAEVVDSLAGF